MKAYDLPIQKLHLETRDDLAKSLLMLLSPCKKALVREGSGLFVGNEAAHYSAQVALLEGWSRLLWGVVPLRKGGYSWDAETLHTHGLIEGTDKKSPYYWGDVADYDQRMVEMAAIALALLLDPKHYWDILQNREKENLITWLAQINSHDMSPNNWRFFRVLVNIAFEKLGRIECNLELMKEDLDLMESMYVGDGWYRDHVPLDNYNPLAMQYYALLYCAFRKEKDPERCERFVTRAKLFAHQHIHFFTDEGPFVPYGRSLTYRFAVVSFYSACAFANLEVLPYGVLKGIILRNLRWWFDLPIFDRDGFLTVGYAYPNRNMAEEYNAPGSPYWSLKTYLVLALENDHPFWKAEELPLPTLERHILLTQPKAIIQRTEDDVVLLNGGQYPEYHMLHCAEKYAKFAYSARYTFSVAASYYEFASCGCDSMLYVSDDNQYYRPRREMKVSHLCNDYVCSEWSPLKGVSITTYLIPAGSYHVRIHRVTTTKKITTKEGGFAISRYNNWEIATALVQEQQNESSLFITGPTDVSHISDPLKKRTVSTVQPQPNLNLSFPNTMVPVLNQTIEAGKTEVLISYVGAWNKNKKHPQLPNIIYDEKKQEVCIEHLLIKV